MVKFQESNAGGRFTYARAVEYLNSFIDFERQPEPRLKTEAKDIERFRLLLAHLGNPHLKYPVVHVVGTKGKGSTSAVLASILQAAGYKAGLYTSPHLNSVRERIMVSGRSVSKNDFAALMRLIRDEFESIRRDQDLAFRTVFELITAAGFLNFANKSIDIAIVEAGLGAKLDATIVVDPVLTILTPIGFDHMTVLGNTVGEIAADKSHAIKPSGRAISSPQSMEAAKEIEARAKAVGAKLSFGKERSEFKIISESLDGTLVESHRSWLKDSPLRLPLAGRFQLGNLSLALDAVEVLQESGFKVSPEAVELGVAEVSWPGRMQVISRRPLTILDGAHNPLAVKALRTAFMELLPGRKAEIVFSAIVGKQVDEMLEIISDIATGFHLAPLRFPKRVPIEGLVKAASSKGIPIYRYDDTPAALKGAKANAGKDGIVLAMGSLYLVGELLRSIKGHPLPPPNGGIDADV